MKAILLLLTVLCVAACDETASTSSRATTTPKPTPSTLEGWNAMSVTEWSSLSREQRREASFTINNMITEQLLKENTAHPKPTATPDERLSDDWSKIDDENTQATDH